MWPDLSDKNNVNIAVRIWFVLVWTFIFSGCAKFNLTVSNLGSGVGPFAIVTPANDTVFFRDINTNVTGNCDPDGGMVNLTGTSITAPASGACSVAGTFSIPVTIVGNGTGLDINGEQTDLEGVVQSDASTNLAVHCVQDNASELLSCPVGGSGNLGHPYLISNVACLQEMRDGLYCHYALANNIDASATASWNGGLGFEPVPLTSSNFPLGKFEGTLDGRNFTLSNITIGQRNETGTGIFSKTHDPAGTAPAAPQIYDLNINNANVTGYHKLGVLAGEMSFTDVINVHIINSRVIGTRNAGYVDVIGMLAGTTEGVNVVSVNVNSSEIRLGMTSADNFNTIKNVGGLIGSFNSGGVHDTTIWNQTITNNGSGSTLGAYNTIGGVFGYSYGWGVVNRLRSQVTMNLISTRTGFLNPSFDGIGGIYGTTNGITGENICNNITMSLQSEVSIARVGGFVGDYVNGYTTLAANKGSMYLHDSVMGIRYTGGGAGHMSSSAFHGFLNEMNIVLDSSDMGNLYPIEYAGALVGEYAATSAGIDFSEVLSVTDFVTSLDGATSKGGVFGSNTVTPAVGSVGSIGIYYANDLVSGHPTVGQGNASPNTTEDTFANLQSQSNGAYSGWNFATRWSRAALPSTPQIRFCP